MLKVYSVEIRSCCKQKINYNQCWRAGAVKPFSESVNTPKKGLIEGAEARAGKKKGAGSPTLNL